MFIIYVYLFVVWPVTVVYCWLLHMSERNVTETNSCAHFCRLRIQNFLCILALLCLCVCVCVCVCVLSDQLNPFIPPLTFTNLLPLSAGWENNGVSKLLFRKFIQTYKPLKCALRNECQILDLLSLRAALYIQTPDFIVHCNPP